MNETQSRILGGLNDPQREAVETLEGPLLILAGAGSGKTRVVTRRIANLIAHGARPWQILAITFTNKAAQEMRHRVEQLITGTSLANLVRPGDIRLSTFHSFSAYVLRREAEVLGYSRDFTIFDEEDASSVLKDIVKRLGFSDDKRFSARNMRQMISAAKGSAQKPEDMEEGDYEQRILKQVFLEYEAELKKNQAFDFDDLLRMAVILFKEHTEVLDRYRDRFKFVLVDEYQDTNNSQYQMVKMLGEKHRNVCATGDPDQSIYGWRGADVRNILSFEKDFPEAKIVKLEQNYRSTQKILNAADAVIENNIERKPKKLWTEKEGGDPITLLNVADEQLEGYEIAKHVEQHVRSGARYNDIAIFYRTNSQSRPIETALMQAAIPYQIIGGTAFYERKEIKDALSYLRLIVNPRDDVAFRRVINVPKRAVGDSAVELIEQEAERRGCSMIETFDGPEADDFLSNFKPKARQGILQFVKMLDALRAMPVYPVENVLLTMLDRSGLKQMFVDEREDERVENLNQLVNAAHEFDVENDPEVSRLPEGAPEEPGAFDGYEELQRRSASITGFLENSALVAPTDAIDREADHVTLMTLHMAKGLEFPVVFISGIEEGLLPMVRNGSFGDRATLRDDSKEVEEERRLMYVGITRAMEKLYLSRAQFRRRFGKGEMTIPSRFLEEIPDKLLDVRDRTTASWNLGRSSFDEEEKRRKERFTDDGDAAFQAFERELDSAAFSDEISVNPGKKKPTREERLVGKLKNAEDFFASDEDFDAALPPFANFEVGDRVKHTQFGEGIIETISGSGSSLKAKVHFIGVGPKLLLLEFAKLKKV